MKKWSRPPGALLIAGILTGLIASCGLCNPDPDPDDPLPLLRLNPERLVAEVVQSSTPDSFGGSETLEMRFDLSPESGNAVDNEAFLELAFRVPDGSFNASIWDIGTAMWLDLDATIAGSVTDSIDYWWRASWIEPLMSQQIITNDYRVRLRLAPPPDPNQVVLRVLEISPRLKVTASRGNRITAAGSQLFIQGEETGTLDRLNLQGERVDHISSTVAPLSFCFLNNRYFGVDERELRYLSSSGGAWQRLAALPWGEAASYALTTDGTDLYLIRRPVQADGESFHVLYRLAEETLRNTSNFTSALLDSTVLERHGLTGGGTPGFAYWSSERHLVVPGTQEGEPGLVTFTRAGRFRKFIPVPFTVVKIGFAFAGDYLFIAGGIPTLAGLRWEEAFTPTSPGSRFLYRWPAP